MKGRLNLLTTATPTVYDFIAGSYTLFGMTRRNGSKRLPRWIIPRSKWLIGFYNEIELAVYFCPTLIDYAVCWRIISIRTRQKYTLYTKQKVANH